jgi:hypothetical protein
MTTQRLPVVTTVDPDFYSNGRILSGAYSRNILYSRYPGEKLYASQRPGMKVITKPDTDQKGGRAIIFWDKNESFYFVKQNKVYLGDYSNQIGTIASTGKDRVFFLELGDFLVLLDPDENNRGGYYINKNTPTILSTITDTDFTSIDLVAGGVSLNGYLFVMDKDGKIWNSELNSPTTWNADFIGSDIEDDAGVYLAKHDNHVAAISTNSVQFFYDAGNPVGSPLGLRQDVVFSIGAVESRSVAATNDVVTFLGRESGGTIGLYVLEKFQITKRSTDSIDRFIGHAYSATTENSFPITIFTSSAWFGEHHLHFITTSSFDADEFFPIYTLVYDSISQLWKRFDSNHPDIIEFAVIDSTSTAGSSNIKGTILLSNGTILAPELSNTVLDFDSGGNYIERDVVEDAAYSTDLYFTDGYIEVADVATSSQIPAEIVTVEHDFETIAYKNQHKLSVIGTTAQGDDPEYPIMVSWTDDRYRTFSTERDLAVGKRRSLTRGGNFKRRAYKLSYDGPSLLRIEGLDIDLRASRYA